MYSEQPSNIVELRREQISAIVRLATREDFAKLRELNLAALEADPSAFGAKSIKRKEWEDNEWEDFIEANHIQVGVNEKGELVAMAGAEEKKEKGVWQLHSVFVDPKYRDNVDQEGRRLGKRLLTELFDTLRDERGATQVDLIVNTKKEAAVELYKRLDFVQTEELHDQPSADGNRYDKLVMSKTLIREKEALPLAA